MRAFTVHWMLDDMRHVEHWYDYSKLTPHGLDFDGLLGCLLDGLGELGLVLTPDETVFACLPAVGRRGGAMPPADLLDRNAAAEHYAALIAAGCLIIEIRGAGWLPGGRYLVLLDHAWAGGSTNPFAVVRADTRGTVWPLSVAWFERLERSPRLRPLLRSLADLWWHTSSNVPVRALWNTGPPAAEQGCPTTVLASRH